MARFGKTGWGRFTWGATRGKAQFEPFIGLGDLGAIIHGFATDDLMASVQPHHIISLAAALNPVPAVDLTAVLNPVPGVNLGAATTPVPGVNLGASGSGHLPENILAQLQPVLPVNLSAYIRRGFSGNSDLGATLNPSGAYKDLSSFLNAASRTTEDVQASVRVISRATSNIVGVINPYHVVDLSASLITQRAFDQRAIIAGYVREVERNLGALIRRSDSGVVDLSVAPFKANKSTHTSGRIPNLTRVSKSFFKNRYALGTAQAGLLFLTLEPVFGLFPDLSAEIFAQPYYRKALPAYIRPVLSSVGNLNTTFSAVPPFTNINKIILQMIPLLNLPADLVQVGGFLRLRASIAPTRKGVTGTAADAGFTTTASTYRFLLGTSRGLFIPPQVIPQLVLTSYHNNFPRPDLHATIAGAYVSDFGAYIRDYPASSFPGSLIALDLSHLGDMQATISPFRTYSLAAELTPFGAFVPFNAIITTAGKISDFGATIYSKIGPLALSVVSVSTKPVSDMGAIINYGSVIQCVSSSQVAGLGAYIKTVVTGTDVTLQNLPATLNVLRLEDDLQGEVTGRKRTRLRTISLTFTSKIRDSFATRASITPVHPVSTVLAAQIVGLSHEIDLPATITPFRYKPHDVDFTAVETVVNLETAVEKQILLSFRSLVSSYVYEDITNAVYATDRDTWAINLRTLTRDESFFDRSSSNRGLNVDSLVEYATLDEAIRHALVILCERRQEHMSASITGVGSIKDLGASLTIRSADKIANLNSALVAVFNPPDITASINYLQASSSSFYQVRANISAVSSEVRKHLTAEVTGNIVDNLGAELTAV